MKKLNKQIAILGLSAIMSIPCLAETTMNLNYNNHTLQLENNLIFKEGRVLLPLRELSETFGYDVAWNSELKQITISEKGTKITLTMEQEIAQVNDENYKLDVSPTLHQGVTYVPLRFVAEAFNMKVEWDKQNQNVNIIGNTLYIVDQEKHQILAIKPDGKEVLGDIKIYGSDEYPILLDSYKTANASEILMTTEVYSGAITRAVYNIFYVHDGQLIKQVVENADIYKADKVQYFDNLIGLCDGKVVYAYDDKTGNFLQQYNLAQILGGEDNDTYVLEATAKDFLLVRKDQMEGGGMLTLIDLTTNKVQLLYELIADEEEKHYAKWKNLPTHDGIYLIAKGGKNLTFTYRDSKGEKQTLYYELGK